MATQPTYPTGVAHPAEAQTTSTAERERGIVSRWREQRAERKRARLVSPRHRRVLAQSLRRTARDANDRNRTPRRDHGAHACQRWCWSPLLHYRAAAVRTDLLEVAARLEQAHDPDPACVAAVRELITNGDSPLYHPHAPVADLEATLEYVRSGL
jgi:hypothetical protein